MLKLIRSGRVIEPLKELFKDEVHLILEELLERLDDSPGSDKFKHLRNPVMMALDGVGRPFRGDRFYDIRVEGSLGEEIEPAEFANSAGSISSPREPSTLMS